MSWKCVSASWRRTCTHGMKPRGAAGSSSRVCGKHATRDAVSPARWSRCFDRPGAYDHIVRLRRRLNTVLLQWFSLLIVITGTVWVFSLPGIRRNFVDERPFADLLNGVPRANPK